MITCISKATKKAKEDLFKKNPFIRLFARSLLYFRDYIKSILIVVGYNYKKIEIQGNG